MAGQFKRENESEKRGQAHPRCAHGIEFDMALTRQEIGIGLHQRRLVATFQQGAGATVTNNVEEMKPG